MNTGLLKDIISDVVADLPVLVKTADGWKRVSFAYEEILWDEKTVPGNELEAFCVELRADKSVSNVAKYDPCRRFKKGDKVRVVAWNGRRPITIDKDFEEGERPPFTPECVVIEEEDASTIGTVKIQADDGGQIGHIIPCFLELVTPVEELEPYSVEESTDYFSVDKDDEELCLYWKDKHPDAKEAAEAECDRLNAAHRKESGK